MITDNILIAYEIFHSMRSHSSRKGSMAIKVDMSKAYDRVEWGFLRQIMMKLGFRSEWVEVVMGCVESSSFSFVINGQAKGWVRASRGLRQGDPISPYLFLLVTEGLIGLLCKAEQVRAIQGHCICRNAPPISHLLFADDSIFFCKATLDQARAIRHVLHLYELASGQQVNVSKSSISFGRGIERNRQEAIIQELGIREVAAHDKYLGLPTQVGRSRKRSFMSIKDRVGQRLSGWTTRLISWAGREVLIKAVAQAIPTYAMSIFKLPKDLCSSIQALINRFWWSHDPDKRKIHWIKSSRLCERKEEGGLGFRHLESFNDAMLAKQVWRLLQAPDSLVYRLLKSKYFPDSSIMTADLGANPSFTWRSLHGVRWVIEMGSRWLVGNGESIKAWESRWLPRPVSFRPIHWSHGAEVDISVADLIDFDQGCWKSQMVRELFLPMDADLILRLPLCRSWPMDKITWHFSPAGIFTVKSAYHLIRASRRRDQPSASMVSGSTFWKKLWSLSVPPRIKLFGWKVGVGALATKANIANRIRDFPASCELCGCTEDSAAHALFVCPVAVAVWSESGMAEDLWGVGPWSAAEQLVRVAAVLDVQKLGDFVAIMWAIWNERNRVLFGNALFRSGSGIASRAIQFVRGFDEFKSQSLVQRGVVVEGRTSSMWSPPEMGVLRLNFDAGLVGDGGYGWGFVVRDHLGDIILMGVQQGDGFSDPETEEARACLFALRCAMTHGVSRLEVEGDCLGLVRRLTAKTPQNNALGFFISDILSLASSVDVVAWKFIKRGGNSVAHAMAHLQPFAYGERVWQVGGPSSIHDLASTDMCKFIDSSII